MDDQTKRGMTRIELWRTIWWARAIQFRRRFIPYLVWHGDEVDVRVRFRENPLRAETVAGALADLHRGSFYEIEKMLGEVGIEFDRGMGFDGRDWEWDWSLRGPISVSFRRRAQRPELRRHAGGRLQGFGGSAVVTNFTRWSLVLVATAAVYMVAVDYRDCNARNGVWLRLDVCISKDVLR